MENNKRGLNNMNRRKLLEELLYAQCFAGGLIVASSLSTNDNIRGFIFLSAIFVEIIIFLIKDRYLTKKEIK